MAVDQQQLHILTHTARMFMMDEQRPNHNGWTDGGYKKQLTIYRGKWAVVPDEAKDALVDAAQDMIDLTSEAIEAARAALEE